MQFQIAAHVWVKETSMCEWQCATDPTREAPLSPIHQECERGLEVSLQISPFCLWDSNLC